MALYIARTYINNKSLALVIPALLARAQGLNAGMALLLEPKDDGTITIHPPEAVKEMLEARKKLAEARGKNEDHSA